MNSSEVFEVIERIGSTSSRSEKKGVIAHNEGDHTFREVLNAALNPFITYGIAKVPNRTSWGAGRFDEGGDTFALLQKLAKRELSGNAARDAVQEEINRLEEPSSQLFRRILLKDLRAGFSESTVNEAIPGLIPTFDCMLAHKFSEHKHKLRFPLYIEPKLDGVRVLTFIRDYGKTVQFFSRSGKEFTTFDHLKEPVGNMFFNFLAHDQNSLRFFGGQGVIEAEVVSGSFNKTVSEVRRKDEQATDAKLCIFDLLPITTFYRDEKKGDPEAGTWLERRNRLVIMAGHKREGDPIILLPAKVVRSEEEIHAHYQEFRAKGLEGVIVKDPNALYHRRRNHAWTKIKAEESVDVEIVSAIEGTGKYEGMLGALIVDYKGVQVNVGSGFSDEQRVEFWKAWQRDNDPNRTRYEGWIGELYGRLIEVEYHEVTPDGSLRHPRFKRFRDDKQVRKAA